MTRDTLSEVQANLVTAGFTEDLIADDGALRATSTGSVFPVEDLTVCAVYRFEGDTDPGDEAILFAIGTGMGEPLGTFAAPYGPAVGSADEAVIQALNDRAYAAAENADHADHDHVAAIFASREDAEAVVGDLRELGLGSEHLGVAVHGPTHVTFENDEESDLAHEAELGAAAGASIGFLAGVSLVALAVPGIGVLGMGGLFAVGAATGFGGAMVGTYLGIAAADEEMTEHSEIADTPLEEGEVLVAVCSHGRAEAIRTTMQGRGGRLVEGVS